MIDQIGVVVFGVGAVFLSQSKHEGRRRWASIVGLISQPFFFYSAIVAWQWGMILVSCLYLMAWVKGFRQDWMPQLRARFNARSQA